MADDRQITPYCQLWLVFSCFENAINLACLVFRWHLFANNFFPNQTDSTVPGLSPSLYIHETCHLIIFVNSWSPAKCIRYTSWHVYRRRHFSPLRPSFSAQVLLCSMFMELVHRPECTGLKVKNSSRKFYAEHWSSPDPGPKWRILFPKMFTLA